MRKAKELESTTCDGNDSVKDIFKPRMEDLLEGHKAVEAHSLSIFVREGDTDEMVCVVEIRP